MSNTFESVLEGQKKALEFWTNITEQMAGTFTKATRPSGETKGEEIFAEWYKKQQRLLEETMKVDDPQKAFQKAPEQFRKWMELQTEYSEKWMKFYRENAEKYGLKLPEWKGDLPFQPTRYFEEGTRYWKKWLEEGNTLMRNEMLNRLPANMRPHYTNFLETYDFMHRYWEPFSRMIQNGLFEKDMVEKYFSTDAYHQLVNQMMGFKPIGNVTEMIDNVNTWFHRYLQQNKEEWGDLRSINDKWASTFEDFITKGNLPFFQVANEINQRLRDELNPFLNVAAQGKETEMTRLLRDIQFTYITFLLKSSELQSMTYEAGQFALPDTLRASYRKYQETREAPDYQAFFNDLVSTLENHLLEVLSSEPYSKLQSELASTGTTLKSMVDRYMEMMMGDLPFLTRSDGDDIARETSALRQKVRNLEAKLARMEQLLETNGTVSSSKKEDPKKKLFEKIGTASPAQRDDLQAIKGIGPKLEKMLNDLGIYTLRQVSRMGNAEYDLIDELLDAFQGRAKRDRWADQALDLIGHIAGNLN